jgi:thiol-disulfide isomerase/thioredoxin
MKRIILLVFATVAVGGTLAAQNRAIAFDRNQPWAGVLEKARAAGKYVFVDCYTEWCGPCKLLDKNVFTNDDVADYYNERFINAKYDMEKGEGIALKEKYGVTAYPTLLFIDARDGEVVHRVVGAGDASHMLAQARIASEPRDNLREIKRRYEEGEKNVATLEPYLKALGAAGMRGERDRVVVEYLDRLSLEERLEEENWKLFETNATDALSAPAREVFAERQRFARALGAERVNRKLAALLQIASLAYFNSKEGDPPRFDEARHEALTRLVLEVEDDVAPACAVHLRAAGQAYRHEHDAMIETARDAFRYNIIRGRTKNVFYMAYLVKLRASPDKTAIAKGVALADDLIAVTPDAHTNASFHEIKAFLLDALGDTAAAARAREKGHASLRRDASPAAPARLQ